MSLVAAMLLSTGAYAGKIIGADVSGANPVPAWEPNTQFGFGGWDLSRSVEVYITNLDYDPIGNIFSEEFGTYDDMFIGNTFESQLWVGEDIRGLLHGKDWPVGEPAGIKIVNGDPDTKNGKPENCILTTSYLTADKNGGVDGLLNTTADAGPAPVICSSPFQSHKRFKVNMQTSTVAVQDPDRYGQPFYLAFNLDPEDSSTEKMRYQVFSKLNNYTGMRLDGYKIEILDGDLNVDENLTLSIGLKENIKGEGEDQKISDIWEVEDMANYSHGLWGPQTFEEPDPHFPTDGFFDSTRAGFEVNATGHDTNTLVGGPTTLGSNYEDLFGLWLPSDWAPKGIFFDNDNDPLTDAELVAFWGTAPDAPLGTLPTWHKGKDYDLSDGDQSWAEPTIEEFLTWVTDPLYEVGTIEDTLNLGLNYIVNIIGDNTQIGDSRVVLRITPRVAEDQAYPSYIDGEGNYIEPVADYNGTEAVLIIVPAPLFDLNATLSVGVADTNVTGASPDVNDTVEIVITTTSGDEENLTLRETDVNSSIFVGTIGSDTNAVVEQDGNVSVVNLTVVTATYGALTASTTATDGTTPPVVTPPSSGGGGGCTYNPNSKNFDMTFLLMMALGMLYPFRRRFLK